MVKGSPLAKAQLIAIARINRIDEQRAIKLTNALLLPYLEAKSKTIIRKKKDG